ncbi:hypothetical protein SMICM17S_09227 [Streptomyces microflavus]
MRTATVASAGGAFSGAPSRSRGAEAVGSVADRVHRDEEGSAGHETHSLAGAGRVSPGPAPQELRCPRRRRPRRVRVVQVAVRRVLSVRQVLPVGSVQVGLSTELSDGTVVVGWSQVRGRPVRPALGGLGGCRGRRTQGWGSRPLSGLRGSGGQPDGSAVRRTPGCPARRPAGRRTGLRPSWVRVRGGRRRTTALCRPPGSMRPRSGTPAGRRGRGPGAGAGPGRGRRPRRGALGRRSRPASVRAPVRRRIPDGPPATSAGCRAFGRPTPPPRSRQPVLPDVREGSRRRHGELVATKKVPAWAPGCQTSSSERVERITARGREPPIAWRGP